MEQPTVSSRDRVNMNGLLNAFDVTDVIAHDCESLNAQSSWVYRNKAEFRLVIKKFFAKIGDYREELESLLTLKFRLVNSQTISFWLYIHLPALAVPSSPFPSHLTPFDVSAHTIWYERSHHMMWALTSYGVRWLSRRFVKTLTMTDFTLHFSCCFTKSLHSHFIPLLNNFTMQEKCCWNALHLVQNASYVIR